MKIEELKDKIIASKVISLDIEYNPEANWMDLDFRDHFWGSGLSYIENNAIVSHWIRDLELIQQILDVVAENSIAVVGHFFQSDVLGFWGAGFTFKKDLDIRCTAIACNFLYEELEDSDLGLKPLANLFLNKQRTSFAENYQYGPDSPQFTQYAKEDVEDQLALYLRFEKQLKEADLFDTYLLVTGSIIPFAEMMYQGIPFDIDAAEALYHKFCILKDEIEGNIYNLIGRIDINSPKQIGNRLFNELKYYVKGLKETPTGAISTDAKNIEKLAEKYPVCELISAYRTCEKMISTYIEPFVLEYERYGKVFDYYYLTSRTGRTRTKRIQLIPTKLGKNIKHNEMLKAGFNDLKIRSMFVAGKGKKLVVRDYSSLEYRTAALAAEDRIMIDMYQTYECKTCGCTGKNNKPVKKCPKCGESDKKKFEHGKDLHAFVRDVTNETGVGIDRQKAKNVSFCIVFHGTGGKIRTDLNLKNVAMGEAIKDRLLDRFKGLKKWHDNAYIALQTTGEVRDPIFGRRRKTSLKRRLEAARLRGGEYNPDYIKKSCANELINAQAQMPACILGQIAIRNFRKRVEKEGLQDKISTIIFVHDEIVVLCYEDVAEYANEMLEYEMENAVETEVPFLSEGAIVDRWSEAK